MVNTGDTAWMLVASSLVFFMMPGSSRFYGGLAGQKTAFSSNASGVAGGSTPLSRQCVLAFASIAYPFVMTFPTVWFTERVARSRVSVSDQNIGLGARDIGERTYVIDLEEETSV